MNDGLDIHVQPDREKRFEYMKQEVAEAKESVRPRGMFEGVETKVEDQGNTKLIVAADIETKQPLPQTKIKLERYQQSVTDAFFRESAQSGLDTHCYLHDQGCTRKAAHHIREVQFDMRRWDQPPNQPFISMSSKDYPGPVPGFCFGCIGNGPKILAEAVYRSLPEIQWGFRPKRWFVVFTDGTMQGGLCQEISFHHVIPEYKEKFTSAKEL